MNIPGPKSHQISRLHDLKADLSLRGWAAAAAAAAASLTTTVIMGGWKIISFMGNEHWSGLNISAIINVHGIMLGYVRLMPP